MKKPLFCALLLCSALLTACGSPTGTGSTGSTANTEPTAPTHTHAPSADWVCDIDSHWHPCDCGEQLDKAVHTLDEVNCTVCGSEVVTWDNGSRQITVYNSYGDCSQFLYYEADGTLTTDERYDYTYNGERKYTAMKAYNNGFLYSSYEYGLDTANEPYMATHTAYYEDGSYQVDFYDENFNTLRTVYHDAVENTENDHRFTYSEDGSLMTEVTYQDGTLVYEQECRWNRETVCWEVIAERAYGEDGSIAYTYDDSGNTLSEIYYKPDGSADVEYAYENVYNLDGDLILKRTFTNGMLTMEMEYIHSIESDGSTWSRSGKTTEYYGDGTYLIRDGDLENTWSSEITYAADGSVINELRYEYLYDENGNSIGSKGYENGRLTTEYAEILDETGKSTDLITTNYYEDGTKTVCEFDSQMELVSETTYDANGNPVQN